MTRAQTTTEYLALVAVALIIGFILAATFGNMASIGSSKNVDQGKFIGIYDYTVSTSNTIINVRNNNNFAMAIQSIYLADILCSSDPAFPFILNPGEKIQVTCYNVYGQSADQKYDYKIKIEYADIVSGAKYTVTPDNIIGITIN